MEIRSEKIQNLDSALVPFPIVIKMIMLVHIVGLNGYNNINTTHKQTNVCFLLLCVCLGTDNKNVPRQPCYLYYSHQIWVCIQASGLWRHILRASILLSDTRSSYVDAKLVVEHGNSRICRVVVRSI